MPTFSPPTELVLPPIYVGGNDRFRPVTRLGQRLRSHYGPNPVGRTVIRRPDATYYDKFTPTQDELDAASRFYLGGHVYEVTDAEAAELTAAGYFVEGYSASHYTWAFLETLTWAAIEAVEWAGLED